MNNIRGYYGIFQLKHNDELDAIRFLNKEQLDKRGIGVSVSNYDLKYFAPLPVDVTLEDIYVKFNIGRPEDFKGHSLSVSDVIVAVSDEMAEAFYVDSFGFVSIEEFFKDEYDSSDFSYAYSVADRFITLQMVEDGYDYNIYDDSYNLLDGGVYDDTEVPVVVMLAELLQELRTEKRVVVTGTHHRIVFGGAVDEESVLVPINAEEFNDNMIAAEGISAMRYQALLEFRGNTREMFHSPDGRKLHEVEAELAEYLHNFIEVHELELKILGLTISGSRARGLEKETSDLDVVVEYEGDMKEYVLYNALNEEEYTVAGIPVDFNPIRKEETGTLSEYLPKAEQYLLKKRQMLEWSTLALHFNSAGEMYDTIVNDTDLYNPEREEYVFHYSEGGSICVYSIDEETAEKLAMKVTGGQEEYWGGLLGPGGYIYDPETHPCYNGKTMTPMEWCQDSFSSGTWIKTSDYLSYRYGNSQKGV